MKRMFLLTMGRLVMLLVIVFSVAYMTNHNETVTTTAVIALIIVTALTALDVIAITTTTAGVEPLVPGDAVAVFFSRAMMALLWRARAVLAGEAIAICAWMLLFPDSLPLAILGVAAGIVIMALAPFVGVTKPSCPEPTQVEPVR